MSFRWVGYVLSLFLAQGAQAELTVQSLFDQKSRSPLVLMPFKIKGVTNPKIDQVQVVGANSAQCQAIVDRFYPDVFLVRCQQLGLAQFEIWVRSQGGNFRLQYGPVEIKEPTGGIPLPVDELELARFRGNQLFNTHCVRCHNPPTLKRARTKSQIQQALRTETDMVSDEVLSKTVFTETDFSALEAYLGGL